MAVRELDPKKKEIIEHVDDYSTVSVQKTLRSFDETVGKIESYKFSNKGVKMCKATCDNCDLRYFCHFK